MKVVARSSVASRSAFAGARVATRTAPKAVASRSAVRTMALFGGASKTAADSIYNIKVTNIDGKEISMSQYKGKALLIVNVASGKKQNKFSSIYF
jgi:Glutathione peroxidase